MNSGAKFLTGALLAALLLTLPAAVSARYNPDWKWRTVTTDHFIVYYPEGHEAFARRVIALAPEVYGDVTGYLGYKPPRLPIVLNPGTDLFNGYYSPLPNRISLYETPTSMLRGFGSPTSDLVDLVYTHEYTHAVNLTTNSGLYHRMARLFGDGITLRNIFAPGWYLEGVTTNTETMFSTGGRGRSPEFYGGIRSFTGDGKLWGLSSAGVSPAYGPPGGRFYLSGYYMVNFLNREYGPDTFARIGRYQGAHPLASAGKVFRTVTKDSPESFYRKFLTDFMTRADSVIAAGKADGLPEGKILLASDLDGFSSHFWTPGGRIRAIRSGYGDHAALVEADPETGTVVRETPFGNSIILGQARGLPDGRVVYGQLFSHPLGEGTLDVSDLTVFDPASGEHSRLTRNAHIFSPAVSPDGKTIVSTVRNGMWIDLAVMDADGGNLRTLVSRDSLYWDAPSFSPDGATVAAALKRGGVNGIALVDVAGGGIRLLFGMDGHGYNEPSFSPDGRWLVFASDRSGVWNAYARELPTGRTFRLTSVPYDAASPLVSPDGRTLSFLSLYRGMYQVRTIPFAPESGEAVEFAPGGGFALPPAAVASGKIEDSRAGIPLRSYVPYLRFPLAVSDGNDTAYGVFAMGGDPLEVNSYSGSVYYGPETGRTGYDISLTNHSFWPEIGVRVYDSALRENTADGADERAGGELSLGLPVIVRTVPDIVIGTVTAGVRAREFEGSAGASRAAFAGLFAERVPERPVRDLVPGWGQRAIFEYEEGADWLGTDLRGHNMVVRAVQYAPSPFRHHGFAFAVAHQDQGGPIRYDADGTIPRGYDDGDSEGGFSLGNALTFSLDYRFPIRYEDRGIGMTLLHLHLLHGAVFADHGAGWNGPFRKDTWERNARTTLGAALRAQTTAVYLVPLDFGVRAGYRTVEGDWFVQGLIGIWDAGAGFGTAGFTKSTAGMGAGRFLRGLRWE